MKTRIGNVFAHRLRGKQRQREITAIGCVKVINHMVSNTGIFDTRYAGHEQQEHDIVRFWQVKNSN
jgi:hypothetical protein